MNVHELPMILFTVIGQMSVGAFWALGAIHLYGYSKKMAPETVDQVTNTAMYAAGPLLVLGFFAAFFHLGDPFNALNTLRHIGSSWQSREIASGILYGASGFTFAFSQWFGLFTRTIRQALAGLTAIAGFLLVLTMAGTYYSVETIPAWHHPATWIFFFGSALLTGSLAVGVALLVTWNMQARQAGGWLYQLASRFHLISDQPMNDELNRLTTKALQGISLSSSLAGVTLLVTYPIYFLYLAGGPAAAQEVADRLIMPASYIRLALLAVVVILAGVFAFVRARNDTTPSRNLAIIISSAFTLAVVTELLGRGMHYEGLWHVGLNTAQTLLGH
ncbi:MAG: dimethyl sulfoxide reductase anchor subunit [Ancrocorticia sp.]